MDRDNSAVNNTEWIPEAFDKDLASAAEKARKFSIDEMYKAARRAEPIIRRIEKEEEANATK